MTSKLADNVVHFTRLLRGAGLRLGPASALDALAAASAVDVLQRDELYWALHFTGGNHRRSVQGYSVKWIDPSRTGRRIKRFPFLSEDESHRFACCDGTTDFDSADMLKGLRVWVEAVGEIRLVPDVSSFAVLPYAPHCGALCCDMLTAGIVQSPHRMGAP